MPTSRRELLLGAAALTAAKAIAQSPPPSPNKTSPNKTMIGVPFEPRETVRMGLIGAGGRGGSMIGEFLACENLRVTAICDINPEHARKAAAAVTKRAQNDPALHTNGEHDYENLCKRIFLETAAGCRAGNRPERILEWAIAPSAVRRSMSRPERGSCEGIFHEPAHEASRPAISSVYSFSPEPA